MSRAVIKQAPRDETIITITTAIQSSTPQDAAAVDVVRQAHLAARKIRDDAVREAARMLDEARRKGHAEGVAQFEEAVARLHRVVGELGARVQRVAEEASETVIDLALEVAARIVKREISANPQILAEMVAEAAAKLTGATEITVRLHPDDLALIEPYRGHLESAGGQRVRIVPDDRIDGGCVVESPAGVADAQIATQVGVMRDAMREAIRG